MYVVIKQSNSPPFFHSLHSIPKYKDTQTSSVFFHKHTLSLPPFHGGQAFWGRSCRRRRCRWRRSCSPWVHRRWRWRLCRGRAQQLVWSPWWPHSTGPGTPSDDSSGPSLPPPRWGCGERDAESDEYRKHYRDGWRKRFRTRILEPLPLCFLWVACDEVAIHVEEADPQQVEDDV